MTSQVKHLALRAEIRLVSCIDRSSRLRVKSLQALLFGLLTASVALGQFHSTQWNADAGLPQNSVRGIVQTPDGYIWVATLNGIARFDGVHFTVFDKSNTKGLTSNRFVAMSAGRNGDFWLVAEDGNVVWFHHGRFKTLGLPEGIHPSSSLSVTSDKNGTAWIDSNGELYRWNEQKNVFEKQLLGKDGTHFRPLWWVGTGFWAVEENQLLYLTRGVFKTHPLPQWIVKSQIRRAAVADDGTILIETLNGQHAQLIDGIFQHFERQLDIPFTWQGIRDWKLHINNVLNRSLSFPSTDVESMIEFNVMLSDTEGNTWVGSEGKGLFRIQKQLITVYSTDQGLAGASVYPVLKGKSGEMWVGTWPAGLSRIEDGKVHTFTTKDGLPGLVSALAEDRDGKLWVGTHGGLRILDQGHFLVPKGLPPEGIPVVMAIYQTSDGSMLLGTERGMYVLNNMGLKILTIQSGLATNNTRAIVPDHYGNLWIGGYGGMTKLNNSLTPVARWTEQNGLPSNNVRSIYEDTAGNIWVGTYDGGLGLFRKDKWTIFNSANGLFDNGVFQILEDAHQNFWMSSNRGIYRVNKADLYAFAEGRQARIQSIGYGKADGMLNIECNGGVWPAGARDDRGFLWFPTQNGVAVLNPEVLGRSKDSPRAIIESVAVDQKELGPVRQITLKPDQTSLAIQYTALSFSKPEQIDFRYKLDGIESEWQYVGRRRTAYYTHLPPGQYVFHLAAVNSDGIWSKTDQILPVEIEPPFFRKWWFLTACSLLALVIAWSLWNYRIGQLKRMQSAQKAFSQQLIASQETERRRIAAELHDSLGQRLIVINNLALFLLKPKGKISTEEDKHQTIQEISSEATAAMEETRAISYDLRPFHLDRLGLSKAIQALVRTASHASEIEFTTDLREIDNAFPEEFRINFFRIVQEAVNNIIKHSGATKAEIVAIAGDSTLQLSISDNGKGLPTESRPVSSGPGGFGLTGIEERAHLLYGTLFIRSHPGTGTQLKIVFSLKRSRINA